MLFEFEFELELELELSDEKKPPNGLENELRPTRLFVCATVVVVAVGVVAAAAAAAAAAVIAGCSSTADGVAGEEGGNADTLRISTTLCG